MMGSLYHWRSLLSPVVARSSLEKKSNVVSQPHQRGNVWHRRGSLRTIWPKPGMAPPVVGIDGSYFSFGFSFSSSYRRKPPKFLVEPKHRASASAWVVP
jgi:hypothetical protein